MTSIRITNIKLFAVLLIIFNLAFSAFGQTVVVDALEFSYTGSVNYLRYARAGVAPQVVVPATVEFPKVGLRVINRWNDHAFKTPVCDEVVSVKSEDGEGELYVSGTCFSDLAKLEVIELPVQLARIDCDLVVRCPALESVTIRSPKVIMIDSPYSSSSPQGSIRALYVQPELVSVYKNLAVNGNDYEKFFLSQFEEILPVGEEDPVSRVTVDGLEYVYDASGCRLSGYTADMGADVVIPTYVNFDGEDVEVTGIDRGALRFDSARGVDASRLKSVTFEAGAEPLLISEGTLQGWTALTTIDLPENTSTLTGGWLLDVPALEVLVLRATSPVEFVAAAGEAPADRNIGSRPVLRVPSELVDVYRRMIDGSGTEADLFLSQMSDIRPLVDAPLPDLTVTHDGHRIVIHQARPGDRIHIESQSGKQLEALELDSFETGHENGTFTIPELSGNAVLEVIFGRGK